MGVYHINQTIWAYSLWTNSTWRIQNLELVNLNLYYQYDLFTCYEHIIIEDTLGYQLNLRLLYYI